MRGPVPNNFALGPINDAVCPACGLWGIEKADEDRAGTDC